VDPDPGARKLRNFIDKNALFSYLIKNFTTKKVLLLFEKNFDE
jgi:hypothetical protein